MLSSAYVELARRRSAALDEADARRMIEAGIALEEKRIEQRRTRERAGYGRRISDVATEGEG
jgi:hypothetical protein